MTKEFPFYGTPGNILRDVADVSVPAASMKLWKNADLEMVGEAVTQARRINTVAEALPA